MNDKNNEENTNKDHSAQINKIISSQREEIKRIQLFLNSIIDIYKEYINISKEFSKKLENLALKIKPDGKTFEGQLVQALQGTLLFNSNSLNEMTEEMNNIFNKQNKNGIDENDGVETFEHFTEVYFEQYNKTMDSYKIYESGVESYENYLIKKELGLIKDGDECYIKDNNKDTNNGNKANHNNNKTNNNNNNLHDNHKDVYINQQKFLNNMRACNDILKNLFDYFSDEKNTMREQLFYYCQSFNENILSCLNKQNETCLNQKIILENLNKTQKLKGLEDKELNKHFLKPNTYSLNCLKMEEEDGEEKKDNDVLQIKNKNKLNIEQTLHILQTFRNNNLLLNEQDKTKEKEEYNKQEIADIIDILFNKTFLYDDTLKQKLLSLLNDKIYQLYFFKLLNKYRTKGKFVLNKTALKNLGYLFQYLNEFITNEIDINLFKLFFIMCLTFYYQDSETYKRYYLLKYVENHKNFKNKKFWEQYLSGLISLDIESYKGYDKEKDEGQDINYITFSNIISVTKSMSDFHLGKEFINEFLEEITKSKYNLDGDQRIQLNYMLADNECGSLNENDTSSLSTEINELNQSSFYNSIDNSDNNLIRPINYNIGDNRISIYSNNSNNIMNNTISNNSNNINTVSKSQTIESKNESEEGSLESIEIEEMNENN